MFSAYYKNLWALLLLLALFSCQQPSYNYVAKTVQSSNGVASPIQPDADFEAIIKPYRAKLQAQMEEVIGEASEGIPKKVDTAENPLGKLCSDMLLAQAKAASGKQVDLALINTGGLRVPIGKGKINVGLIFELMPFENEVVIITIKGKDLKQLFEKNTPTKVWPVSGAQLTYRRGKLVEASINGQPLKADKDYYLATSDYLAKGGDDMGFLIGKPAQYISLKVRDAFIQQIKAVTAKGQKIQAPKDSRASFE